MKPDHLGPSDPPRGPHHPAHLLRRRTDLQQSCWVEVRWGAQVLIQVSEMSFDTSSSVKVMFRNQFRSSRSLQERSRCIQVQSVSRLSQQGKRIIFSSVREKTNEQFGRCSAKKEQTKEKPPHNIHPVKKTGVSGRVCIQKTPPGSKHRGLRPPWKPFINLFRKARLSFGIKYTKTAKKLN